MKEDIVFEHTLHKKFWKIIAESIYTGENRYYGSKESAIVYGIKHGLFTSVELDILTSSEHLCMACSYDEKCQDTDIGPCENCPLVVPDRICESFPIKYSKNGSCLRGLYDYFVDCSELVNFIDTLEQGIMDNDFDDNIRHILHLNVNWVPLYIPVNKNFHKYRLKHLHYVKRKLIKSLVHIARTIANLPVAPGIRTI